MGLKGEVGVEIEIHSPALKFFNLFVTQLHTKLHQGDWHGVGSHSVKHWTYTLGV
ncbi:MLP-like protein 43 [Senna tora]|uniref:MLP-like protein 43 n=1 Tax=Senna tora TaxID=362788 RepID=A0A834T3J3_9FABA|nr:MLP-like protein 43 [Senna tora]